MSEVKIDIRKTTVYLSEQTMRELWKELEETKEKYPYQDVILMRSDFSDVEFIIAVETKPHTQESLGYHRGN